MNKKEKCVELYFDSKKYNNYDVLEYIKSTQKEFPNKEMNVKVDINEWGVYVIKLNFTDKDTYITSFVKSKLKPKRKQYYGKKYGQYKSTQIYKPY